MIIVVQELDENSDIFRLGKVETPQPMTEEEAGDVLNELWGEWREAVPQPDTDSEFIDWLVEVKGWKRPEVEVGIAVIS